MACALSGQREGPPAHRLEAISCLARHDGISGERSGRRLVKVEEEISEERGDASAHLLGIWIEMDPFGVVDEQHRRPRRAVRRRKRREAHRMQDAPRAGGSRDGERLARQRREHVHSPRRGALCHDDGLGVGTAAADEQEGQLRNALALGDRRHATRPEHRAVARVQGQDLAGLSGSHHRLAETVRVCVRGRRPARLCAQGGEWGGRGRLQPPLHAIDEDWEYESEGRPGLVCLPLGDQGRQRNGLGVHHGCERLVAHPADLSVLAGLKQLQRVLRRCDQQPVPK
mmetsp:Transcript_23051/g.58751  ORF Transcript_23051/g.58751 Transcript_23051/m.58751 type:complete len:285 (-) Transcript_23051:1234-2088(-)